VDQTADADLLRRMAAGDEHALGTLYDRWHPLVHGAVVRILSGSDDVDDVVEEVFWQAWRQAGRYEASRGGVHTWLLTIARSRALDRARTLARRREEPLDDGRMAEVELRAATGDPSLEAEASSRRAIVLAALAELPPEQREAVELGYFDGLSQTEIATRTGLPLGTIKTRTRLALRKLRDRLRPSREDLR
jgi:RNA polymerase sigma-70 factor (ECF subfamily)